MSCWDVLVGSSGELSAGLSAAGMCTSMCISSKYGIMISVLAFDDSGGGGGGALGASVGGGAKVVLIEELGCEWVASVEGRIEELGATVTEDDVEELNDSGLMAAAGILFDDPSLLWAREPKPSILMSGASSRSLILTPVFSSDDVLSSTILAVGAS